MIQMFNEYVRNKSSFRILERNMKMPTWDIDHVNSQSKLYIQIIDYVARAAFRKFERGNSTYYDRIK